MDIEYWRMRIDKMGVSMTNKSGGMKTENLQDIRFLIEDHSDFRHSYSLLKRHINPISSYKKNYKIS
jgi:hypothetical protein